MGAGQEEWDQRRLMEPGFQGASLCMFLARSLKTTTLRSDPGHLESWLKGRSYREWFPRYLSPRWKQMSSEILYSEVPSSITHNSQSYTHQLMKEWTNFYSHTMVYDSVTKGVKYCPMTQCGWSSEALCGMKECINVMTWCIDTSWKDPPLRWVTCSWPCIFTPPPFLWAQLSSALSKCQ